MEATEGARVVVGAKIIANGNASLLKLIVPTTHALPVIGQLALEVAALVVKQRELKDEL